MTPKEEIANQILETKSGDITKTLKPYAIGKWVPVSERLPVADGSGRWAGYTKDLEGLEAFGLYDHHLLCVFYSAWLELDLPEVGE